MQDSVFLAARPPELMPWVTGMWYSSGHLEHLRETVVAAASTDIVVNLGEPMKLVRGNGVADIRGTTVTGLISRPFVLEHPVFHEALGIRLSPHGIRAVLGIPPGEFQDAVVDLSAVDGIDSLFDACIRFERPARRMLAAARWLKSRIRKFAGAGDGLVLWATSKLDSRAGKITVKELQEESGLGPTRFNRRFVDELGLTPKKYMRLLRFRGALELLEPGLDFVDLAVEAGYADQPHMIREFREFANATPSEFLARRYPSGLTLAGGE